jgi:hypothetical protein
MGRSGSVLRSRCSGGTKSLTIWNGWPNAKAKVFLKGKLPAGDPA